MFAKKITSSISTFSMIWKRPGGVISKSLTLILFVVMVVAPAAKSPVRAQSGTGSSAGISTKKPVFGGACMICPWGAMGQVVKEAMRFNGYDVQICHNCNAAAAPVIVSEAQLPPPYKVDPNVSAVLAPPNKPGLGPVDFGATSTQSLCAAYHGTGNYATRKPMDNLRLIANIQSPWYMIVAARADTNITDLSQIREKRWPVRILAQVSDQLAKQILAYYGLSVEEIKAAGGYVGDELSDRSSFDVIIHGGGSLSTAPEWNVWYEVSQKVDLHYLSLPEPLLAKLAQNPQFNRGDIPVGLLKGIEQPIPTVVRGGTVVYARADAPDSFAYDVAKSMDEHQDLLQYTNHNFSYNVHNVWKACDVPLHPGAARYYREMHYMK